MTLRIESLSVGYRRTTVLHDVTLTAPAAAVLGVLGPNGCGKSTLLRTVCRILRPRSGRITLDDTDLAALPARALARTVAYVPQSTASAFALTVTDSVLLGRSPHMGMRPGPEDWAHVDRALAHLDLTELADQHVGELSGGQQQRVLLARALAQDPRVLLLDEPTSALDLRHRLDTMDLVQRLAHDAGLTVVVALHDLDLAARHCDQVAFVHAGRVLCHGSPAETYTPATIDRVYDVRVRIDEVDGVPEVRPLPRT